MDSIRFGFDISLDGEPTNQPISLLCAYHSLFMMALWIGLTRQIGADSRPLSLLGYCRGSSWFEGRHEVKNGRLQIDKARHKRDGEYRNLDESNRQD
jgi:hypothetical protein